MEKEVDAPDLVIDVESKYVQGEGAFRVQDEGRAIPHGQAGTAVRAGLDDVAGMEFVAGCQCLAVAVGCTTGPLEFSTWPMTMIRRGGRGSGGVADAGSLGLWVA